MVESDIDFLLQVEWKMWAALRTVAMRRIKQEPRNSEKLDSDVAVRSSEVEFCAWVARATRVLEKATCLRELCVEASSARFLFGAHASRSCGRRASRLASS